jgi:hypothetical protein
MKTSSSLKLRVSLGFIKLGVSAFLLFMRQVVIKMTGNTSYPTPTPTLPDVTTGLDTLEAKIEPTYGGGTIATEARDMAWDASIMQARQLVNYVQMTCDNNPETLTSSGFLATKTPGPVGSLGPPQNLRTSYNGTSGSLYLLWKRVYGIVGGYTVQQAAAEAGPFADIGNATTTKYKVSGLTPATTYWFRVRANGTNRNPDGGPSGWSSAVSVMAV